MRNALKRRPSPAMIVGVLALVMAMAGTSVAALNGPLNGNQIKKQSIGGGKIKKKTLTGFQINTGKLGTVPNAQAAQTAVTAQSAQTAQTAATLSATGSAPLKTRWFLLNEAGQIEEQSGGFTVIDAYVTNDNAYIDTGASMVGHGITATIAIQNQIDTNGEAGPDPNFAGEVSVARCQVAGVVACAPPGAKNLNALVVSPRQSDGEPTKGTAENPRKRVYVTVTP